MSNTASEDAALASAMRRLLDEAHFVLIGDDNNELTIDGSVTLTDKERTLLFGPQVDETESGGPEWHFYVQGQTDA